MTNKQYLLTKMSEMSEEELAEFLFYDIVPSFCGKSKCTYVEVMFNYCPDCPKRPKISDFANWMKKTRG